MTFQTYASMAVLPRLSKLADNALRIDVVFDIYLENSLKNAARSHRGQGSRRRVKSNSQVPKDWKSFLRHSENKTDLFSYLAHFIHENLRPEGKTVLQRVTAYCVGLKEKLLSSTPATTRKRTQECFCTSKMLKWARE